MCCHTEKEEGKFSVYSGHSYPVSLRRIQASPHNLANALQMEPLLALIPKVSGRAHDLVLLSPAWCHQDVCIAHTHEQIRTPGHTIMVWNESLTEAPGGSNILGEKLPPHLKCCVYVPSSCLWMGDLQNILSSTARKLKYMASLRKSIQLVFVLHFSWQLSTLPGFVVFSSKSCLLVFHVPFVLCSIVLSLLHISDTIHPFGSNLVPLERAICTYSLLFLSVLSTLVVSSSSTCLISCLILDCLVTLFSW